MASEARLVSEKACVWWPIAPAKAVSLSLSADHGEHVALFQAGPGVGNEGELHPADPGHDHAVLAQGVDVAQGGANQLLFCEDELAALIVGVEHNVAVADASDQLSGDFDRFGVAYEQEQLAGTRKRPRS